MNYYNQHLIDDFDNTGETVRRKNKLKAINFMNLSVSFCDPETLEKIREVFSNLPPEQMIAFKEYLSKKEYLKKSNHNSDSQKIIGNIAKIALNSNPNDEKLRKIKKKYRENLARIDEIKIKMSESDDPEEMNELFYIIEEINEENIHLFEDINQYSQELFSK